MIGPLDTISVGAFFKKISSLVSEPNFNQILCGPGYKKQPSHLL